MKKIILTLFYLFIYTGNENLCCATEQNDDQFKVLGRRYVDFMSKVGQAEHEETYLPEIPLLFSKNCRKIENGNPLFDKIEDLQKQLRTAREYVGMWNITLLDLLSCPNDQACVVRFSWKLDKIEMHITTAILRFDSEMKIIEINETFNRCQYSLKDSSF